MAPPTVQINQLMCCEVPGDEPIVKFINILDPLKLPPGVSVTKDCGIIKLQVSQINNYLEGILLLMTYN